MGLMKPPKPPREASTKAATTKPKPPGPSHAARQKPSAPPKLPQPRKEVMPIAEPESVRRPQPAIAISPVVSHAPAAGRGPVDIMGLTSSTCRWPTWTDATAWEDRRYCGDATADGEVYCCAHCEVAFGRSFAATAAQRKTLPPALRTFRRGL